MIHDTTQLSNTYYSKRMEAHRTRDSRPASESNYRLDSSPYRQYCIRSVSSSFPQITSEAYIDMFHVRRQVS